MIRRLWLGWAVKVLVPAVVIWLLDAQRPPAGQLAVAGTAGRVSPEGEGCAAGTS